MHQIAFITGAGVGGIEKLPVAVNCTMPPGKVSHPRPWASP
jgi:hypothetical protein